MHKRLGLVGAHRTGKTTLAASDLTRPFIQTNASSIISRAGFSPEHIASFLDRLYVQELLLQESEALWKGQSSFITDRTPVDFLMYTYADIQGVVVCDDKRLSAYRDACLKACVSHFDCLILIQPGIPVVPAKGKALLNISYIEHLNFLAKGLLSQLSDLLDVRIMPRHVLELEERLKFLS